MRRWWILVSLTLVAWLPSPDTLGHPLDPALLELTETADTVDVLWRLPASRPRDAPLEPVLPKSCTQLSLAKVLQETRRVSIRWSLTCGPGGLVGEQVGVDGLDRRQTDALVRIQLADGRRVQKVLRSDDSTFLVPASPRRSAVFSDYLSLGFEHILGGLDHLLFVLGLTLLVRGRLLFWTITAFTVGHSITLSLAVLGLVGVSPAAVEVLIAASLFAVAVELTRDQQKRAVTTSRYTWAVALAFGLLHGLGFAGALTQIGLPQVEIPLALFSFNLGIELGQLLFVAGLLLGAAALRRLTVSQTLATATPGVPAYVIGSLAAFWIFERLAGLLSI